jgi:cytochrome b561
MEDKDIRGASAQVTTYSTTARRFHWWTVAFLAVQIPVGLYMAYRGNTLNVWDGLTNALYSSHKLLGITILVLVLARLIYRLSHGAPPDEPTLTWWQKGAAHLNHWGLYLMLLVVPIMGYVGISLYPALDIFGLFSLPGIVAPNQDAAARVLYWHWVGAVAIVLLVGMHVGAALFHYLIRRDGVLQRMWVRAGRLS